MEDSQKKFDSETGTETVESLLARKEISDADILQIAQHLESLKSHPGFKILNQFVTENVTYWSTKLLECNELPQMIRCQEIIKSYQGLLSWMETSIDQARILKEQS